MEEYKYKCDNVNNSISLIHEELKAFHTDLFDARLFISGNKKTFEEFDDYIKDIRILYNQLMIQTKYHISQSIMFIDRNEYDSAKESLQELQNCFKLPKLEDDELINNE